MSAKEDLLRLRKGLPSFILTHSYFSWTEDMKCARPIYISRIRDSYSKEARKGSVSDVWRCGSIRWTSV